MRVYLDDVRSAPDGWVLVCTVGDAVALLLTGDVTEISLDNDLGDGYEEGYKVAEWIERAVFLFDFFPPNIYVHSSNPPARARIEACIRSISKYADLKKGRGNDEVDD